MLRPRTRLAAGTLAVLLPLAAVAGCGVQKQRTIKAEFTSAGTYLQDSKAASFTLRLDDSQHKLAALLQKDADTPAELADAFAGGSITYVVDPVSDKVLRDVSATPTGKDVGAQLKTVNLAFVIKDSTATLGELRVVDGVLYLHVDLAEIGRLAKAGGVEDFDASLDSAVTGGPPEFASIVKEVRAGKWVKLDLAKYLTKLTDLADTFAQGFTGASPAPKPSASAFDAKGLGQRLFDGVKPYVKVTDANDNSSDRVLDVTVDARPALKAALKILAATDDLPFPNVFSDIDPTQVDDNIGPGLAKGQIRLADGHLKQISIDAESIRKLAIDPGTDSVAGLSVVFDVDDSAVAVQAPSDVSSVDLGELVDQFLDGINPSGSTSTLGSSYSG